MRILHLIGSMNPASGGPCQGIRNSIPVLEKLGIYREVVSLDDPADLFIGIDTFPIHALGPGKTPWCYSDKLMPWLEANLMRFDAIIVNGLWLYPGYAVRKALQKMEKTNALDKPAPKLFVMPHGMLDPYFQKASHRKLKAIRNWFYWKLVESKNVHAAEALLFTCETELELARTTFKPYKPKRELNVGYGVSAPPAYEPVMQQTFLEHFPTLAREPYLLFLSRVHNKKGVDMLLQSYLELAKDTLTALPKLVVAGPGMETAYGKKLKEFVEDNDVLSNTVVFTGMLTGNLKWGAFYGCDAFILPSHQENFGIAVVEAMACGKPVLISNQVNIWKEIAGCVGGIVADDTPAGTYKLLKNWHGLTATERKQMGENAAGCFQTNFTIEAASQNLFNVLSKFTFLTLSLLAL